MENLQIIMAGATAVILFVFGLEHFSREIEKISGEKFRKFLAHVTRYPVLGLFIGALVTAVIQSSSATSIITISLVNAGVLSFANSVGIIFGANIGTTVTAQLVAFKLTAFAPLLIIGGFLLTLTRTRFSIFGRAIFYFGFVFFSLNLIASSLEPLRSHPQFISLLAQPHNPLYGILAGIAFTALVQSSSVTTGLAIIFTQQGLLSLENAVPLIMGANIGTTATAFIAVFGMDIAAKKSALSHFLFNVGGVILFLPVLLLFGDRLNLFGFEPAVALATIHLVFNVGASLVFLVLAGPFVRVIDWLLGEGKMDFERLRLPAINDNDTYGDIRGNLQEEMRQLFGFLQENYNLVTLSIETNYRGIHDAAGKRIEYIAFLKREYLAYFSRIVSRVNDETESRDLMRIINRFDYLFQIHDSIVDLFDTRRMMSEQYIEVKSDILLLIREISSETLNLFDAIANPPGSDERISIMEDARTLQKHLDEANRRLLTLLSVPDRRDAGALTNFFTYSQRLKDKLINYTRFAEFGDSGSPRVNHPAT